jgi:DNA processing protein
MNEHDLFLILTRGLPAEAVRRLAGQSADSLAALADPRAAIDRQRCLLALRREGLHGRGEVTWPDPAHVHAIAERVHRAGAVLAWRGETGYPPRLAQRLGPAAPAWVWIEGSASRLTHPACAIVGSRDTSPAFLAATRRLAHALAEAGLTVVSGMAPGADSAAHEGAMTGRAGTVAIPARGLLQINLAAWRIRPARLTCLCLDRPDAPFSAGLAIRRNDIIAALGEGLILAASDLRGGSSYAVRWVLAHGQPLWALEAGARDTPPANRHLIERGLARALTIDGNAEEQAREVAAALKKTVLEKQQTAEAVGPNGPGQLDLW